MAFNRWQNPRATFRANERAKKRAARLHYHICDGCPYEGKYACCDYHCKKNKKRLCGVCRRNKKYHYIEPDLFESVMNAAKNIRMKKHKPEDMIAVHMESHFEFGGIVHTFWAMWSDGTKTQMTSEEIAAWSTNGTNGLND